MSTKFPVLSHSNEIPSSYDVVVIGAGIGGLVAANLLALEGHSVLMVEQHYVVGGYCSTFKRKKYVFDSASHFYPLLGNPTSLTGKLLERIGCPTNWVKMDPVDRFHLPDGSTFTVSADFETYLAELKRQFPDESAAIDRFFDLAKEVYLWRILHFFREKPARRLKPYFSKTLRAVIDEFFSDRRLKLMLTADTAHWGSSPNRTSFVFDSLLRLSYFLGNYYPQGGSQVFADDLARRLTENGGDILLKSRVKNIRVEDGAATGVGVEIGPLKNRRVVEIAANSVVSNADMRLTVEQLVGTEHFTSEYVQNIQQLRPTHACYLAHLGVRDVPREKLKQISGYYWSGWDSDRLTEGDFDFKVFVPTLYEPSMAPENCDVLIIQKISIANFESVTDWQTQ